MTWGLWSKSGRRAEAFGKRGIQFPISRPISLCVSTPSWVLNGRRHLHRRKIDHALHGGRRIVVDRGYLGASAAGCRAFLVKPATFRPDLTTRELVNDGGHDLNDAGDQAAIGAVVVRTTMRLAGRGQPEDFSRLCGSRHGKHIGCNRKRLIEVRDLKSIPNLLNDPEHTPPRHCGLRTRA
jgi:hypothetical protein